MPATAAEQTPSDAAMRFVIGVSDDHLAGLLGNVGGRSEIMAALGERHGDPVTDAFNTAISAGDAGPTSVIWARDLNGDDTPDVCWADYLTSAGGSFEVLFDDGR